MRKTLAVATAALILTPALGFAQGPKASPEKPVPTKAAEAPHAEAPQAQQLPDIDQLVHTLGTRVILNTIQQAQDLQVQVGNQKNQIADLEKKLAAAGAASQRAQQLYQQAEAKLSSAEAQVKNYQEQLLHLPKSGPGPGPGSHK